MGKLSSLLLLGSPLPFPFRGLEGARKCKSLSPFGTWDAASSSSPLSVPSVSLQQRFVWSWKVLREDSDKSTPRLDHVCFPICEGSTGAARSSAVPCEPAQPPWRPE